MLTLLSLKPRTLSRSLCEHIAPTLWVYRIVWQYIAIPVRELYRAVGIFPVIAFSLLFAMPVIASRQAWQSLRYPHSHRATYRRGGVAPPAFRHCERSVAISKRRRVFSLIKKRRRRGIDASIKAVLRTSPNSHEFFLLAY